MIVHDTFTSKIQESNLNIVRSWGVTEINKITKRPGYFCCSRRRNKDQTPAV